MRVVALTAHGLCGLQDAEGFVLAWFESEGLELVHGQQGVLIGWGDATSFAGASSPPLAVEVRLYPLGGGGIQARWTVRLGQGEALTSWADQLLASLQRRLEHASHWRIDAP